MGLLHTFNRWFGRQSVVLRGDERPAAGAAGSAVASLLEELKQMKPSEVRNATGKDYLEVVITRDQIEAFTRALENALGPPAKPFGRSASFDPELRTWLAR